MPKGSDLNVEQTGDSHEGSLTMLQSQSLTHLSPIRTLESKAESKARSEGIHQMISTALNLYNGGHYKEALMACEEVYDVDAFRTDNLLLIGAVHFQLRNFSEAIFYCQQCIRVDPNFAEGYSNLGNALKELGDVKAAVQFYLKAIKLKPKYCDAYNNLAGAYMQLGQMQDAIETYQMALTLNPALVDAHSNLGNLYKALGDLEAAKRCYMEAVRIKPEFAIAWSNLAGVFKDQGQTSSAVAYYKEGIRLCPEFADAHSNLGNALRDQGLLADAVISYKTAIKLRPDFAIAYGNLGVCHWEMKNHEEALKALKYAIQLEPNYPDAFNNLGNVLRHLNKVDDAIQAYRSALRLKPDHPHAYNNLGNAMRDMGMIREAIHCYVTSIRLLPTYAAAHSNLGSALKEQGKINQAIAHYQEAINIDPMYPGVYNNLGNCYKEASYLNEAFKCYQAAIKIQPQSADAYANMANVYKDSNDMNQAVVYYRRALELDPDHVDAAVNLFHTKMHLCDWEDYEADVARVTQHLHFQLKREKYGNTTAIQPFQALSFPLSLGEIMQVSQLYANKARNSVALVDTHFTFRPKPRSIRYKIGYVSSDFGNHPLSHAIQSIFGMHDTSKFEIFCYALSAPDGSKYRKKIETETENFKDISQLHAGDAAQLIHNDGIHILINLNGYTKGAKNEIFALRPAPVQMQYLGYAGTMGADYIDYIIADETVVPTQLMGFYKEKVLHMPNTYFVTDHKQSAPIINKDDLTAEGMGDVTRSKYGISEDKFVFCCFNQLYKIDPVIFAVWMRLLKRVDNSVLWLLQFPTGAEDNIRKEALKHHIRPEQLIFSEVTPREEHIKRGYLADLFLDTPAYNAHTTAADILWSGTPLVTLQQDKMSSRVASSLLHAIGLDELTTSSPEDYEELAFQLAQDSSRLYSMRNHIETCRTSCAVFDTKRWVNNLERGYLEVWRSYESGTGLDHITIIDEEPVFTTQGTSIV